jgi:hypothetical protein
MIAFESGIDEHDLKRSILPRLEPKVIYIDGWVYIKNFEKYHSNKSKDTQEGIRKAWNNVPEKIRLKIKEMEDKDRPPLGGGVGAPSSAFALSSAYIPDEIKKDEEIRSVDIGGDFGDIKPLKAVPALKTNPSANPAFAIANMWIEMVSNKLNLKKEEINVPQLFYPINACIKRNQFTKEDFKELFTYFLNDKLPDEKKIAYNLCLSANYVAQFNVARKSRGKTNAGISGDIRL